ncbi:hypothetical protein DFP72DRAFT_1071906 [Ephemerocybe angulata]|uniref:Uncharacterized protein n=1 Tax=Ephemerocybe angulata TaxID=980116 RepID=A0A8H6HRJ6_9AGAR|nr:hypothetical protein DFP72DRAFT_1071906 [Tulosesus angulatus]
MPLLPSKPSISPPTLSSFELFLFRAPARAVECLLNWMDEADIVRLSELGTKMFYWVHAYSRRTWNFEDFIGLYMSNPSTFLGFFNGTDAMIYGKSVFRFFLRSPHPTCPLDVCSTLSSFYRIQRFLAGDGFYMINPSPYGVPTMHEMVGRIIRATGITRTTWSLNADKSWTPEHHQGFRFQFVRIKHGRRIRVNLHLIRCEPYRHVLGAVSFAPYMCCMTNRYAFSLFAKSTFVTRIALSAFAAEKHKARKQDRPISIRRGDRICTFETVLGPPVAYTLHPTAEVGPRYLGDKHCWVLPREREDPNVELCVPKGPSFEAVDWTMVRDEQGSYLTIGEPFVWSARYLFANPLSSNIIGLFNHLDMSEREISSLLAQVPLFRHHPLDEKMPDGSIKIKGIEVLALLHDSIVPTIWHAPTNTSVEGDNIAEEVDLRVPFFPNGAVSALVCTNPSSAASLPYTYRVYMDPCHVVPPLNRCIEKVFKKPWMGNVVVVRYARNYTLERKTFSHVQKHECEVVVALVGEWLDQVWKKAFERDAL